ncbi:hypothetical protein RHGRI_000965 [Rhododendron griersonianum]|uniref:Uncharacterized protein n=1 Tax=Rhododendron griersonianum TaxID=479676 RepID=A0AAV6LIK0_9ERIC|nr:hypothetical protein RHGRI_000965 [Rhododendron griersonianum]
MNTLEREKKGEEEKRDLRRTRRGDPSQTSRKAATTAMMTITTAAKRTAMKKARDLVRASSAGFELSFEWILCIFGGYVKEDLPPHLDSTSEPPPLFDGTTRSASLLQLRRERIAERMRAMQEVVPSCNKSYGIKIGYGGISGPSGVRDGSSSQGGGCCS